MSLSRTQRERLLEDLARLEELGEAAGAASREVPSEESLRAYRQGLLPELEARRLETLLADNDAARMRLLRQAGIVPRDRGGERTAWSLGSFRLPRTPRTKLWTLAAAASLFLVAAVAFQLRHPVAPSPVLVAELPRVEASIRGLAEVRSRTDPPSLHARSTPGTAVEITARLDPPRAALEVALYVPEADGGAFRRLPLRPRWESRSTARFRVSALELVGSRPGLYPVYVAVATEGRLPQRVTAETDRDALEVLAGEGMTQVRALSLELIPEAGLGGGVPGPPEEKDLRP